MSFDVFNMGSTQEDYFLEVFQGQITEYKENGQRDQRCKNKLMFHIFCCTQNVDILTLFTIDIK